MNKITEDQKSGERHLNVLLNYQGRIFYKLSITGIILLLPFAINNFIQQRFLAGIFTILVLLIFAIDAYKMSRGEEPPIPPATVFFPILIGIGFAIEKLGIITVMWVYPAMILFFFVLPKFTANILNILASITVTLLAYYYNQPQEIILRIFATTMMTIVFINIILGVIEDLHENLKKAAINDDLTGAYNRKQMNESLKKSIEYKKRYQTSSSLIILDIDNFKAINDTYGHSAGDQILKQLVELLKTSLRNVDTVFRFGGEEFIILLPETNLAQAKNVADKLCKTISEYPMLEGKPITASLGVGEVIKDENIDSLLKRCDAALYQAKHMGKNQVMVADESYLPDQSNMRNQNKFMA